MAEIHNIRRLNPTVFSWIQINSLDVYLNRMSSFFDILKISHGIYPLSSYTNELESSQFIGLKEVRRHMRGRDWD